MIKKIEIKSLQTWASSYYEHCVLQRPSFPVNVQTTCLQTQKSLTCDYDTVNHSQHLRISVNYTFVIQSQDRLHRYLAHRNAAGIPRIAAVSPRLRYVRQSANSPLTIDSKLSPLIIDAASMPRYCVVWIKNSKPKVQNRTRKGFLAFILPPGVARSRRMC